MGVCVRCHLAVRGLETDFDFIEIKIRFKAGAGRWGGAMALARVGRLQRGRQWHACFRQGKGGHPTKATSYTGAFPRSFDGVGHMTCASSHMACHQPAKWPPNPAMPNDRRPDARNPRGIFKTCIAWLVSDYVAKLMPYVNLCDARILASHRPDTPSN